MTVAAVSVDLVVALLVGAYGYERGRKSGFLNDSVLAGFLRKRRSTEGLMRPFF
jgi:hypothetical protein